VFIREVTAAAAIGGAAATVACGAQPEVSSVGPQGVASVAPAGVAETYVPGGTIFSVRLDQPLDSYYTAPGSTFTATVVDPLREARGRTVVEVGARMHGAFVSSGSPDDPRIQVRIDTIDTVEGTVPLAAVVREAQHLDLVGPTRTAPHFSSEFPYGALEYGPTAVPPPEQAAPNVGYALEQPREVRVPRGALMELQLTRPLVLGAAGGQPR
jgi:hypothetical protein